MRNGDGKVLSCSERVGAGCCGELHFDWSEGTAESKAALVS